MDVPDDALIALRRIAEEQTGLDLLLLHGSRARGRSHGGSDWDLAYLGDEDLDAGALHTEISRALRTDNVDLVDLARASALLRFEAARHGQCVYARTQSAHRDFVLEATIFWCDAEAVIRRAHAAVLTELPG